MKIHYPGTPESLAGKATLRLDQLEAIYRIKREITEPGYSKNVLVGAGMGSGKAQPLDSLVLTPNGFIRMGDVSVGIEVVTPGGDTALVSGVFPQGERPVYRVTLMDGREVLADADHLWTVLDRNNWRKGYTRVVSTSEMLEQFQKPNNAGPRYSIATINPVDLGVWDSALDPYLVGALLGNGGLTQGTVMFSSGDQDTLDRVASLLPGGVRLRHDGNYDYQITTGRNGGRDRNPVLNELRRLGIMGHGAWTKSIPAQLMHSSIENRLSLVQGLLDTDGSAGGRSGFEFSSASPQLAKDFVWLIRSLGGRATQSAKELNGKKYQRVYGRLPENLAPFRCQRKLEKVTVATKYPLVAIGIRNIEHVEQMQTQCIMVDHESHEYVTDEFTRTHNTVVSVEVIMKTNPRRTLIVGVRDAYGQWAKAFKEQGSLRPLYRLDATVEGADNFRRLLDGDEGLFYAGLEMLRAKDWEQVSETYKVPDDIQASFGLKPDKGVTEIINKQKHIYKKMKKLDLLISDEAHRHSNQQSNSIKTMNGIPATSKIALSGTFFGNKFINAWSLTCWLWGRNVIGFKGNFEEDFCVKMPVMTKDGKKQMTTKGGFPLTKILGERNPGEFVETLPCYVFIATPIGPVPKPEIVKVDLGAEQTRQYREMEAMSLTWIPTEVTEKREPLIADLDLTQRLRLRTAALGGMTLIPRPDEESSDRITFSPGCKSAVLDAAYKVLHRATWEGKKVLILTHSKPFAEEVARRIGQKYSVALKTGGVSSAKWEIEKARFMLPVSETGSVQYLVAVISAVGTAMDGLQANCAKVLWLSEDENNTNNMQGDNRVWRDGVIIEDYEAVKVVPRGTIAEGVLSKNNTHRVSVLDSVAGKR
jgi:hypothetical protein